MQKSNHQMSFTCIYVSRRKLKSEFFTQINKLVDWTEIQTHYNKGFSVAGRPSYPDLLLFKMCLLQTWYGLSDYEVEEKVNDSLSFMQFVGAARVKADKGYASAANRQALKDEGLRDNIMHKTTKSQPLTGWQVKYNQIISKTRYKTERTTGSMKRWFRAAMARYIGLTKTHTQHLLEAMAYNLYRSPGIVAKNALLITNQ